MESIKKKNFPLQVYISQHAFFLAIIKLNL